MLYRYRYTGPLDRTFIYSTFIFMYPNVFFLLNNKDKATIYRNVWIKIKAFIRTLFNYVIWYVLICEITLPLYYFMYTEVHKHRYLCI